MTQSIATQAYGDEALGASLLLMAQKLGNFLHAFSHIVLINCAHNLTPLDPLLDIPVTMTNLRTLYAEERHLSFIRSELRQHKKRSEGKFATVRKKVL